MNGLDEISVTFKDIPYKFCLKFPDLDPRNQLEDKNSKTRRLHIDVSVMSPGRKILSARAEA